MHLIEEYAKHNKVKGSTQKKNIRERATMRKTSNSAVKITDSGNKMPETKSRGRVNKNMENY